MNDRRTLAVTLPWWRWLRRRVGRAALRLGQLYMRRVPGTFGKRKVWHDVCERLQPLEQSRATVRTIDGDRLRVDPRDILGWYVRCFGVWEPNLSAFLRRRLKLGDAFFDIGAHVGYFSALASRLVGPTGAVVAVEPVPVTYELLARNAGATIYANLRTLRAAAWDVEAEVEFWTQHEAATTKATLNAAWAREWRLDERVRVPALPAASMLSAGEAARLRLVKLDVEGAEWRALKGLEPLLARQNDVLELVIEVTPALLVAQGTSVHEVEAFLGSYGFFPYEVENSYAPSIYIDQQKPTRPRRLPSLPHDRGQLDVVFSRVDADVL